MVAGLERGVGFAQFWNFQTSWVKDPAPCVCRPKNKAVKTLHAQFARAPDCAGPRLRGAADEVENRPQVTSIVLHFVRVRTSLYKPP